MTDSARASQRTVLVIDDDLMALDTTRIALELAGFRVLTRDRASDALVAILRDRPDLVLLEVGMASWTAALLSDIQSRARKGCGTSLVFHSSLPNNVLRLKVLASGAHGFIQKTNVQLDLVRQVRAFLTAREGSAPRSSKQPTGEGALSSGGMRAALAQQAVSESAELKPDSGTRRVALPTVLFLDDDLQVLTSYRRALSSQEMVGEYLTSADQAVRRIASEQPPDVVVADLVLPGMNGIELYRRALDMDPTWRHRFVFVTGQSSLPRCGFPAPSRGPRVAQTRRFTPIA